MSEINDLHVAYRPEVLEDVAGHKSVIQSLEALQDDVPHALLFEGPSGTGKTTLARIIAMQFLEVSERNLREVDAATYAKAEDARRLVDSVRSRPLDGGALVYILDEVHALSNQSWQILLKTLEEPPPYAYFILCTTESNKVPKTIRTRCHSYELSTLSNDELFELLDRINTQAFDDEVPNSVLDVCAKSAGGSPRQAVVNLSKASYCNDTKCAYEVLKEVDVGDASIINICRHLAKPPLGDGTQYFIDCVKLLGELGDKVQPESVRMTVVNYFAAALMGKSRNPTWFLTVLDAFKEPCRQGEKMAPILLAIGFLAFQG